MNPSIMWHTEEFTKLSVDEQRTALLAGGPFCIAENINLQQFHVRINEIEKTGESLSTIGYFRWEFKDGKAWIYELPHRAHANSAGRVVTLIGRWYDEVQNERFTFGSSPRCNNNAGGRYSMEPDGAVCLADHRPGPGRLAADEDDGN
jgi:Putative restriction endonuclease